MSWNEPVGSYGSDGAAGLVRPGSRLSGRASSADPEAGPTPSAASQFPSALESGAVRIASARIVFRSLLDTVPGKSVSRRGGRLTRRHSAGRHERGGPADAVAGWRVVSQEVRRGGGGR
ncbi:hypothetical protein GCM10010411_05370 [Actinomadura fulvescens]|uniref:Uncharacterized protein n=1 Tax=Actinomadura fulvescens TaxID=46160 RepID=A0ABN3PCR8_9ACTN